MTREVICYITNNTPFEYYPGETNLTHGKKEPTPAQAIAAGQNNGLAFSFSKTTGSMHGVTGSVTYGLSDGSTLFLGMNCPFLQEGRWGNSNCWFYGGLTGIPDAGTPYYVSYTVSIDGAAMDPNYPPTGDTITVYLTIYMN